VTVIGEEPSARTYEIRDVLPITTSRSASTAATTPKAERDPAHLGDHRLLGGLRVDALGRGDHLQRSLHG
jgi:hypothetical protein